MTATAREVLALAASQIGVKEEPANSNRVKYNTEYYGNDKASPNRAWCCVFQWWVFKHSGASELFYNGKKCAGCTTLMNFYRDKGQLVTGSTYRPGDLVFFQFDKDPASDHIGIIESDNGGTVTTIEGNTSLTSQDNGGSVMRRIRKKSLIMAVARPEYEVETVTITLDVLQHGDRGEQVKTLQRLLTVLGHDTKGTDGIFGNNTLAAVKAFQTAEGLSADGIVGAKTWNALLK